MTAKVAVIVGSLRRDSVNRQFAEALGRLVRPKLEFDLVEIADLPLYNQDLEVDLPAPAQRLKRRIEGADAVLFVTPEFNRSFSSALKNAVEWGSRPWGKNSWAGKPGAIVGMTLGAVGTAAAQSQLRSVATAIDVHLMAQPEIYLSFKDGQIVEGEVADAELRKLLEGWADRFADWIARLKQPALAR